MAASADRSESIAEALDHMHPELAPLRHGGGDPVYLVGGAVRDLLLGRGRADVDVVVVGDAAALARELGEEVRSHERFGTAKLQLDGHEVDVATARTERYPRPGALPEVEPAAAIEDDLRRRDFTINAIAIALQGEPRLIDPFGGEADLAAGLLRVLHPRSFEDDPTRAIRAARYAGRFGFGVEGETERCLREADLNAVSAERREAELMRLAAEASAPEALRLLARWGLVEMRDGGEALAEGVAALLGEEPWQKEAPRARALLRAALGPPGREQDLAAARPGRPSEAVALATRCDSVDLVLARALGAEWLDRYLADWRGVELEIDGSDLIAAGVAEGPALGRGLREAMRRKLDGEIAGREEELAVALATARSGDGVA